MRDLAKLLGLIQDNYLYPIGEINIHRGNYHGAYPLKRASRSPIAAQRHTVRGVRIAFITPGCQSGVY